MIRIAITLSEIYKHRWHLACVIIAIYLLHISTFICLLTCPSRCVFIYYIAIHHALASVLWLEIAI